MEDQCLGVHPVNYTNYTADPAHWVNCLAVHTVHTVHWTQGRQGTSYKMGSKLQGQNCRHVYSLLTDAAAVAAAAAAAKSLQSCPTLRPHSRQPTRLLHPWDFPGEGIAVGATLYSLLSWLTQWTQPWYSSNQFSSVQSLSCVWLFATPWTAACQASLSITNSWSLLKFMSIELVMPSSYLILCRPLLLTPSMFPSIRAFSNESVLRIRWPRYWSSINMPLLSRWSSHICAPHKVAHDQVSTPWCACAVLPMVPAVTWSLFTKHGREPERTILAKLLSPHSVI